MLQVSFDLVAGLQDIVYPGETMAVASAVASIASTLIAVWYWDEEVGRWLAYSPTAPDWANDLTVMTKGETYSINMTEATVWVVNVAEPPGGEPVKAFPWRWVLVGAVALVGVVALSKRG